MMKAGGEKLQRKKSAAIQSLGWLLPSSLSFLLKQKRRDEGNDERKEDSVCKLSSQPKITAGDFTY